MKITHIDVHAVCYMSSALPHMCLFCPGCCQIFRTNNICNKQPIFEAFLSNATQSGDKWVFCSGRMNIQLNFYQCNDIPDICHFLFTGRIFKLKFLHQKIPNKTRKVVKYVVFRVQSGKFYT